MVYYNTAGKGAKVEEIQIGEAVYRVVRLPQYEKDLKGLAKLEVKLHDEVTKGLIQEIESGKHDEIKGTGGWVKGRAASPSRNMGKSGAFRFLYLFFRVQKDVYLQAVYDHRAKVDLTAHEKKLLKVMAEAFKKAYEEKRGKS